MDDGRRTTDDDGGMCVEVIGGSGDGGYDGRAGHADGLARVAKASAQMGVGESDAASM